MTPARAAAIQRRLAQQVRETPPPAPPRLVAGVDCAFLADRCLAAAVLWDADARRVLEVAVAERPLRFPYVPGFLSFREAPAILAALRRLRREPDAILCDGQGRAHPRRFGIACHVGLLTGRPTAGCAKSLLVGEGPPPGPRAGDRADLRHRDEVVGVALRTQDRVRPVYVSVGHNLDLPSAIALVLRCVTRFRLPEPTRLADLEVAAAKLLAAEAKCGMRGRA